MVSRHRIGLQKTLWHGKCTPIACIHKRAWQANTTYGKMGGISSMVFGANGRVRPAQGERTP